MASFLFSFKKTILFDKNRYYVIWPWKEMKPNLPSNYNLALGRLKSLLKSFKNDEDWGEKNEGIIQEERKKGIIERLPEKHLILFIIFHIMLL